MKKTINRMAALVTVTLMGVAACAPASAALPGNAALRVATASAIQQYVSSGRASLEDITLIETQYQWSVRLMNAQLELAASKGDRQAALDAHMARMEALRTLSERQFQAGQISAGILKMVVFYNLEAAERQAREPRP